MTRWIVGLSIWIAACSLFAAPGRVGAAPAGSAPAVVQADEPAAEEPVPTPAETPVDVVVSGRTSTLNSITIRNVGKQVPPTLAGIPMTSTEGFSWYVSRHYALKTDYDEARARHLLTLLELTYPHYVALFGREIPGIDQRRMAVIYGSSKESLRTALQSDNLQWDFNSGGITFEHVKAAYNYPSGSLQYHQRYIMLHECTHLYQMCLAGTTLQTPKWFYEGIADYISHHVWDPEHNRLTLSVVDKATTHNWYDEGLRRYAVSPFTAADITSGKVWDRDAGFLLVAYLATDPDRLRKLRSWLDETLRESGDPAVHEKSERLFQQLFGPPDRLDADFAAWLHSRHASFHYVDWGWEQDGDTLMSYGWPQTGEFSQTDLNFPPGQKPASDPLLLDYPHEPLSPLVDTPRRGVDEPVVGCVLGFRQNPDRGEAGLGLGVEGRTCLKVLVNALKTIVLDGADLGAGRVEADLAGDVRQAMQENGWQVGLSIRITAAAVEVTLRAGKQPDFHEQRVSLPITPAQRQRLLSDPLAVLSRGGKHYVTPAIDAGNGADTPARPPAW